jgi:hypothetical protein
MRFHPKASDWKVSGVAVGSGVAVAVPVGVMVLVAVLVGVAVRMAAPDDVMRLRVTDPPGRLGAVISRSMTPLPKVDPPSTFRITDPPGPSVPVGFRTFIAPSG